MRKIVNKSLKNFEFSKGWLLVCIAVSIIFTAASYILSAFDKQPLENLSSAVIETLWGTSGVSFIGYAIQNSVRAYTATKLGIVELEKEGKDEQGNNNTSGNIEHIDSNNDAINSESEETSS